MFQESASISTASYAPYLDDRVSSINAPLPAVGTKSGGLIDGIARRWRRERRRRKVGRAYDMALEIARMLPLTSRHPRILDVGCGNGFIGHHLSAILGADVTGIDLEEATEAPINYRRFGGTRFPARDKSFEAVLLCYVLHHAQDLSAVLHELHRVLNAGGIAIVYEDIPDRWWDRLVCRIHDRKWRHRTGPCTFRLAPEWSGIFRNAGFDVVREHELSRWRNVAHPVARRLYVLKLTGGVKFEARCARDAELSAFATT